MESDSQITMTEPSGFVVVLLVALFYLGIRLLPRFVAGFNAYISPTEVKRQLDAHENILLLDLRSHQEFFGNLGHVPSSINIPLSELNRNIAKNHWLRSDTDRKVVVICQTGTRAAFALPLLRRAGIRNALVMSGGLAAWLGRDFPVEHD
jgi:rhodanese-related sulfurtransferase